MSQQLGRALQRSTLIEGYIWNIPHDPIGCIRSAAMFYVVPVATIMKTMFNMGLRATSGCRSWRLP
eukprot:3085704-Pleurochrysis_carterae.AAC.1